MNASAYHENRILHRCRTVGLFAALAALAGCLGWTLFGPQGIVMMTAAALFLSLASPRLSTTWMMRIMRARPLLPGEAPALEHITRQLAHAAGLQRVPRLYLLPQMEVNAFATGTGHDSSIALSSGLLRGLDRRELIGVLAHEMSHIAQGDIRVMGAAATLSSLIRSTSFIGFVMLLLYLPSAIAQGGGFPLFAALLFPTAPYLAALIHLAISRTREYAADTHAAALTGDPRGLASALNTLERLNAGGFWQRLFAPRHHHAEPKWLKTHPTSRERIKRLLALEAKNSYAVPRTVSPLQPISRRVWVTT